MREVDFTNLTEDQVAALMKVESTADLDKILYPDRDGEGAEVAAMLGAEYSLGKGTVRAVTAGALPALALLESPYVCGDESAPLTAADTLRALYVVVHGEAALAPIMGIQHRTRSLAHIKEQAERSPELWGVYLEHLDAVTGSAWGELDAAAYAWWSTLEGVCMQDAADLIVHILTDAFSAVDILPKSEGTGDSPKPNARSALSGWARCWGFVRQSWAWIATPLCGRSR